MADDGGFFSTSFADLDESSFYQSDEEDQSGDVPTASYGMGVTANDTFVPQSPVPAQSFGSLSSTPKQEALPASTFSPIPTNPLLATPSAMENSPLIAPATVPLLAKDSPMGVPLMASSAAATAPAGLLSSLETATDSILDVSKREEPVGDGSVPIAAPPTMMRNTSDVRPINDKSDEGPTPPPKDPIGQSIDGNEQSMETPVKSRSSSIEAAKARAAARKAQREALRAAKAAKTSSETPNATHSLFAPTGSIPSASTSSLVMGSSSALNISAADDLSDIGSFMLNPGMGGYAPPRMEPEEYSRGPSYDEESAQEEEEEEEEEEGFEEDEDEDDDEYNKQSGGGGGGGGGGGDFALSSALAHPNDGIPTAAAAANNNTNEEDEGLIGRSLSMAYTSATSSATSSAIVSAESSPRIAPSPSPVAHHSLLSSSTPTATPTATPRGPSSMMDSDFSFGEVHSSASSSTQVSPQASPRDMRNGHGRVSPSSDQQSGWIYVLVGVMLFGYLIASIGLPAYPYLESQQWADALMVLQVEMLRVSSLGILVGALGGLLRSPTLIGAGVCAGLVLDLTWSIDAILYYSEIMPLDELPTGLGVYLGLPKLDSVEFAFSLHHMWLFWLCSLVLYAYEEGYRWWSWVLGNAILTAAVVGSRFALPLEVRVGGGDGLLHASNVNMAYESYHNSFLTAFDVLHHDSVESYLLWAVVVQVMLNSACFLVVKTFSRICMETYVPSPSSKKEKTE